MSRVEVVKRVVTLNERIPNEGKYRHHSYLRNRDFRNFIKHLLNKYENKIYSKSTNGKSIQFHFSEQFLLENNLIPEWSNFNESIEYYLNGFGNLTLDETVYIGDQEISCASMNISTMRGIVNSIGLIECEIACESSLHINLVRLIDKKFELLQILINDLDEMNELENCWFDFSEEVSIDDIKLREIGL
jgi:hypothetical protein